MRVSIKESELLKFGNKKENILLSVFVNNYEVFDVDLDSYNKALEDETAYVILKSRKHYLYVPIEVLGDKFIEIKEGFHTNIRKATEKQLIFLRTLGYSSSDMETMTLSEASQLISKFLEEKRNGNKE